MRKVFLFMMVTLDGYFEGENHDISWHNVDKNFNDNFIIPQTKKVTTILFGRTTYEMMASFWPSDDAKKTDPITANLMDDAKKFVFSTTLKSVDWKNSVLVSTDAIQKVRELKEQDGNDIAIFGSNKLMVNLADAGLVDEFRIIVNPIALGSGTSLFTGLRKKLDLRLIKTQKFENGNVLLLYT